MREIFKNYKPLLDYPVKIPKEHKINSGVFKDMPKTDLQKYIEYIHESEVGVDDRL